MFHILNVSRSLLVRIIISSSHRISTQFRSKYIQILGIQFRFEYHSNTCRALAMRMQPVLETEFVLFRLLGYSIARIFVSSLFLLYIHICIYCMLYTHDWTFERNPAFEAQVCQESLTYRFLLVGQETKRLLTSLFFFFFPFILTT